MLFSPYSKLTFYLLNFTVHIEYQDSLWVGLVWIQKTVFIYLQLQVLEPKLLSFSERRLNKFYWEKHLEVINI